jgi:Flp pilus assembly pilin Flp
VSCAWPSVPAIADAVPRGGRERPRHRPAGQGLVEYGLILSLIVVVAIITLVFFGDAVAAALNFIGQVIDSAH